MKTIFKSKKEHKEFIQGLLCGGKDALEKLEELGDNDLLPKNWDELTHLVDVYGLDVSKYVNKEISKDELISKKTSLMILILNTCCDEYAKGAINNEL